MLTYAAYCRAISPHIFATCAPCHYYADVAYYMICLRSVDDMLRYALLVYYAAMSTLLILLVDYFHFSCYHCFHIAMLLLRWYVFRWLRLFHFLSLLFASHYDIRFCFYTLISRLPRYYAMSFPRLRYCFRRHFDWGIYSPSSLISRHTTPSPFSFCSAADIFRCLLVIIFSRLIPFAFMFSPLHIVFFSLTLLCWLAFWCWYAALILSRLFWCFIVYVICLLIDMRAICLYAILPFRGALFRLSRYVAWYAYDYYYWCAYFVVVTIDARLPCCLRWCAAPLIRSGIWMMSAIRLRAADCAPRRYFHLMLHARAAMPVVVLLAETPRAMSLCAFLCSPPMMLFDVAVAMPALFLFYLAYFCCSITRYAMPYYFLYYFYDIMPCHYPRP